MDRFNRDFRRQSFGPREMHKAVCSSCKKECEVPFKPTEGRPVFCRDCFLKSKGKAPEPKKEATESEESDEFAEAEDDFEDSDESS